MERIEVRVRQGFADPAGVAALHDLRLAGLNASSVRVHQVYFVKRLMDAARAAREVLVDPVLEERGSGGEGVAVSVSKRPGVMDPSEASVLRALRALGERPTRVVTAKTYWIVADASPEEIAAAVGRSLANAVIEEITPGEAPEPREALPATLSRPVSDLGLSRRAQAVLEAENIETIGDLVALSEADLLALKSVFPISLEEVAEGLRAEGVPVEAVGNTLRTVDRAPRVPNVPLAGLSDDELLATSRKYVLALNLHEMHAIRDHFRGLGRAPRLGELETIAQTWSEHCKHKTLTGPIDYTEDGRTERISNLLKETIFASTQELARDWCVSVFKDNAGIVRFDDEHDVCFKVETHNHPSAIEPYGGAGTGIGGVIRDILGTGLGAKPVANTDVFCFGPLDTKEIPDGVLHPLRVMRGVVAGVRDYGNRMGIPTVNGTVCFDPRYLGNPLVYCGTVGILPRGMHEKAARPGDRIVVLGARPSPPRRSTTSPTP